LMDYSGNKSGQLELFSDWPIWQSSIWLV
jgi:hypothetical protein